MFATLIAVLLTAPTQPPKEQKEKEPELPAAALKEVEKLQGKWKAVKGGRDGKEYVFQKTDPELLLEFKGRRWVLNGVEKAEIVALDPKTDPKCIDLKSLEKARGVGVVDEAIFKIEGDTLSVSLYQGQGKNRPSSFETPKEKDTILLVFERVPANPKK